MDRLFIELYLDEDVDVLIAELLRAYGHVAVTTRDAGRLGKSDADQLEILDQVTADEMIDQSRYI